MLITDHHLPAATLPAPALIVNPNQPGCEFPGKHLAGVGVMFYVLLATRALLRERGAFADRAEPNLGALLDLVALGTVADVVRLDGINRTLVAQGLARIRAGRASARHRRAVRRRRPRCAPRDGLRPRLRRRPAAQRRRPPGRHDDRHPLPPRRHRGRRAAARERARPPQPRAARRRGDDAGRGASRAGRTVLRARPEDAYTLCLFRPEWHQGVVGIVASRLKDRYHRPAIVFARGSAGELKGSGRSIAGFHLRDALDLVAKRAPGVIARFGGHAYAAGLSLAEPDLPRFAAAFEAVAREQLSTREDLARVQFSDGGARRRPSSRWSSPRRSRAEVWGQGFPSPAFDDRFDRRRTADRRRDAIRSSTLERRGDGSCTVSPRSCSTTRIRFRPPIRAVYRPDVNEWNGTVALQLVILHWEPDAAG